MPQPSKSAGKIGEILAQCGMVTPMELEEALTLSRQEGLRLGEALVRLGVLGPEQLSWALGIQFDLTFVDLRKQEIDWDWLLTLPLERLQGMMLLPIEARGDTARVVIADPTVDGLKEVIEQVFSGQKVTVQLASGPEIDEAFEEAGRRRHRVGAVETAVPWPRLFGNPLLRWIPRLESGRIERVVVAPGRLGTSWARVIARGLERNEELSASELRELLEAVPDSFAAESAGPSVMFGLRTPGAGTEDRAIRSVLLRGAGGWLLVLAGIGRESPVPSKGTFEILVGEDPRVLKSAILEEFQALGEKCRGSAAPLVLSFEMDLDRVVPGVFQVEIREPGARVDAFRRAVSAARPEAAFVEVESAGDLGRLAGCPERDIPLLVSVCGGLHPEEAEALPPGMRLCEVTSNPTSVEARVHEIVAAVKTA